MTILRRATALDDLDLSADGRNLEGLAFRWEHPSMVTDDAWKSRYWEEFHRRSSDRTINAGDRPLFVIHEHLAGSVGEVSFSKASEGLAFRARLSDTKYAAATLERIHDPDPAKALQFVSVGFRPIRNAERLDPRRGVVKVRAEIAIAELSLAPKSAALHEGAEVLAVRATAGGTPKLDAARRRRQLLELERSVMFS